MPNSVVHNIRFYKPKSTAITCTSLQKEHKKLAVARCDASIEVWNLNNTCYLERRIAPSVENYSIEGLTWCHGKLYSVGIHGLLVEYDLKELRIKHTSFVTGGSAFCLDGNRHKDELAIGTEQGYLNIFEVTEDGLLYIKTLDKQEGSIICLKYDHSGRFIVSGSPDAIRIWDVVSGQALHKTSTGRSESNKETMVWCLQITSDFTIISGDSRGKLTFWDGNNGGQIVSYQSHRADILSLCVSDDENSLFCAGIDPTITHYSRINLKDGNKKWVKSIERKIHEHDVRVLALCDDRLYSGGVDSYIACSYHPPKTVLKFPLFAQSPYITVSKEARLIMLRYVDYMEIWTLGEYEQKNNLALGLQSVIKEPQKLLSFKKTAKTETGKENKEAIVCSSISNDGKYIVYSWNSGTKLFRFDYEENVQPKLYAIENFECESCSVLTAFTPDNTQLIVALPSRTIQVYTLKQDFVQDKQNIDVTTDLEDTITFLLVSHCSKYLVAADAQSDIVIYYKNQKWTRHCKLPKYKVGPVALGIHPKLLNLVVAYADNKLVEYDIRKREFTNFSRVLSDNLPTKWLNRSYPVRTITFDPDAQNIIILHDDNSIIILDKDKKEPSEKVSKVRRVSSSNENIGSISTNHMFKYITKYKHLIHLEHLDSQEIVAVEVTPLSILEQLPPGFIQKKFGQK